MVKSSAKILICFALEDEARASRKLLAGRDEVAILITGIGRKNAERSLRGFLDRDLPRRVFTCGFAGGLNPELETGDVVFSTDDPALAESLTAAGAAAARFHCHDRIATTAVEKSELHRTSNADVVEMESEIIRKICRERGISSATVRVISDAAWEDLPLDFNRLAKDDLNLDYGKLAWAIVKAPGKIPALLRLQKHTRFAAQELAGVLQQILGLTNPDNG